MTDPKTIERHLQEIERRSDLAPKVLVGFEEQLETSREGRRGHETRSDWRYEQLVVDVFRCRQAALEAPVALDEARVALAKGLVEEAVEKCRFAKKLLDHANIARVSDLPPIIPDRSELRSSAK